MSQSKLCQKCHKQPCICGDTEDFFLFEGKEFFTQDPSDIDIDDAIKDKPGDEESDDIDSEEFDDFDPYEDYDDFD